jgi:hypothetical protein
VSDARRHPVLRTRERVLRALHEAREFRCSARHLGNLALAAAAFAFGLVVACVLGEVGLRLFVAERPVLYGFDDQRGWAAIPGAEGVQRDEGNAFVRFDAEGYRDREHPVDKPPGTYRIAALGDSYTDAIQVDEDATWWRRLEGELGDCPALAGRPIEVLDFGVRGYSTAQELLTWRMDARRYHPDAVVLLYTPENDLVENTPALSSKVQLAPFFVLDGDALVLEPPTNGATVLGIQKTTIYRGLFALHRHSRLVATIDIEGLWNRLRDDERAKNKFHAPDDPALEDLVTYSGSYLPPTTPELAEAWRVTEAMIGALADEADADGARLFLAAGSSPVEAFPDPAVRERLATRLGVADLGESERRLDAMARQRGIPFLALAPAFAQEAEASGTYLHGFPNTRPGAGHWNVDGHRLAAHELAGWMCAALPAAGRP